MPVDVKLNVPTFASATLGVATTMMHSAVVRVAEHAAADKAYAEVALLSLVKVLNGTRVAAVIPHAGTAIAVATAVATTVVKAM